MVVRLKPLIEMRAANAHDCLGDASRKTHRPVVLALARQLESTSILGDLTSQCISAGVDRCRYSRPRAASSAMPRRRSQVRPAAHSGEPLPWRSTSYRLPRAQYSAFHVFEEEGRGQARLKHRAAQQRGHVVGEACLAGDASPPRRSSLCFPLFPNTRYSALLQ